MKISKIITVCAVLACMVMVLPSAQAQKRKKKKKKSENSEYFEDEVDLKDRLWYGGGLGLGFAESTFNFSISPMVGYKIFERLSVGPRIPIDYLYVKQQVSDKDTGVPLGQKGFSVVSFGAGVFTRFKVMDQFFFHGEYSRNWGKQLYQDGAGRILWDGTKDKVYTETQSTNSASLGLGYSSGDLIGYEVSVLYDFLLPESSQELPFEFRIGFNYNF